jgi:transcriptional regulator NrdR family protein
MTSVIKRGGKKQEFSPAKIRHAIEKAAKEAKVAPKKAEELVEAIVKPISELAKSKRVIKAVDIRKSVLGRLDRRLKSVASSYRRYEKKKNK